MLLRSKFDCIRVEIELYSRRNLIIQTRVLSGLHRSYHSWLMKFTKDCFKECCLTSEFSYK